MAAVKPPIPVGTAKVACSGTYGPTSWVNVFYVEIGDTAHTPGVVIADIAAWFHDLYETALSPPIFWNQWSLQYTTVSYRDAADSMVRVRVSDVIAGTGAVGGQDAQVAYLVNWSTGDPRRGGKPRSYFTGVDDQVLADTARLTGAAQAGITGRLITWLESGPTQHTPMQLLEMSFRNGKTWRDAAFTYPIIGASLNPVVATQRRRVDRLRPS